MPSAADVGAAPANHSHDYVQVLNGLTGTVSITGGAGVTVSTASSSITIAAAGGGGGISWLSAPASPTSAGTAGQIAYDGSHFYLATATNTWKRAAISTWNATDPLFSSVSLLLRGDGAGSTFVDSSSSPKTITPFGSATQSTAQSKWGGSSALLGGGSSNYLSVGNSSAFAFGADDFVIEFWLWFTQTGTQFQLFSLAGNQSGGLTPLFLEKTSGGTIAMSWSSNGSNWVTAGDGFAGGSTTLATSTWHHVALSRSSGTFRIYINGDLDFTDAASNAAMQTGGDNPSIGVWPKYPGSGGPFHIDDFRITKGSNRGYTGATITVPTEAFPIS
jgi:hypothetical protein